MVALAYDTKRENKLAADWLLNYHEYRNHYIEAMSEFNTVAATAYTGMPHGSGVGKPCENKSITLTELETNKQWIMAIEDTERVLSEKKRAFLDIRRQAANIEFMRTKGRPGWIDYVQSRFSDWHERRYGFAFVPSRRALQSWWEDIVEAAARIAIRRGCL